MMNDSRATGQPPQAGLCPRCTNVQIITSTRGSTFFLCQLSYVDPRFPRYPVVPVIQCSGFKPQE